MASKFLKNPNGGVYKDSNGRLIKVELANKLPLVAGYQDTSNRYDITADDLEGVTEIRGYTFRSCTGLKSIELPSSCTKIGFQSFWACAYMTIANMPNVESIGEEAFEQCSRLTTVNMPNVKTIGTEAFMRCTNLQWIDMQSVESIGWEAFYDCERLSTIDIPNATTIDTFAFTDCKAITSVNMPKVVSIGSRTFDGCKALAHLTIPSTCTSIGTEGLQCGYSNNKCTFTFEGTTPPSIQSNTFAPSYLNKIIVPQGCGDAYKTATNWSRFASYIEEATA